MQLPKAMPGATATQGLPTANPKRQAQGITEVALSDLDATSK